MAGEHTIEIGQFEIRDPVTNLYLGSHLFWVMRDSSGAVVREMHGLATDSLGNAKVFGGPLNSSDTIEMYDVTRSGMLSDQLRNVFTSGSFFSESSRSTIGSTFIGSEAEVLARWAQATAILEVFNRLNIDYGPLTGIGNYNSNSVARYVGQLMGFDVPPPLRASGVEPSVPGWKKDLMAKVVDGILDDMARLEKEMGRPLNAEELQRYVDVIEAAQGLTSDCFPAGTPILLQCGKTLPIDEVDVGDVVLSYDATGTLVPGRVTRTFRNEVSHLLDVHGLKVTPGHATLCGDGMFKGRHVPIIDILLSDGALERADGSLIRMAINAPVGSVADAFVKVAVAATPEDMRNDTLTDGEMRVGTLLFDREGVPVSVLDCLTVEGYAFDPKTGLVSKPGAASALLVRQAAPARGLYPDPLARDAGGYSDGWGMGGQQAATDRGAAAAGGEVELI
ncbi:MAG: hypothetical protein HC869_15995 [Rhodospirillales bacterium]|nr:hypothetical protein [Rhodospirillales bacterium]